MIVSDVLYYSFRVMYTKILLRRKRKGKLIEWKCKVSFPSCRPHCGKCGVMRIRVYIRDKAKGQFHGIGWICPGCLEFKNDIEEAERKNAMFHDKVLVPLKSYVWDLLHFDKESDDDF
jgi:hypothetical protein